MNKLIQSFLFISMCVIGTCFADSTPMDATKAISVMAAAGPASASAAPVAAPVAAAPADTTPEVSVAEPAAPPQWAQDLIVTAEGLPIVGPIVAKVLLYAGILSSILTTVVGCLLVILNTLMGVMNLAGIVDVANAVAKFRDGKIMYWLRFFSLFNAKKKPEDPSSIQQ